MDGVPLSHGNRTTTRTMEREKKHFCGYLIGKRFPTARLRGHNSTRPEIRCSKLTTERLDQRLKYVQN